MERYTMDARAEFGQDAWAVERKSEDGCWVLYKDAHATIARLTAELAEARADVVGEVLAILKAVQFDSGAIDLRGSEVDEEIMSPIRALTPAASQWTSCAP